MISKYFLSIAKITSNLFQKKSQFLVALFLSFFAINSITLAESNPTTKEPTSIEDADRTPVPTGKYITGGILGTAVGFGIGHGIQGRYSEGGLMFTLTEAGGYLIGTSALLSCSERKDDPSTAKKESDCSDSELNQVLLGYGVFLGFHIWEIVDVWRGARPVEEAPRSAMMILPHGKDGAQLSFSYLF